MGESQDYDPKEIIYRIGTFFLLIGIGALVIFMLSEAAEDPQFNYFCASLFLLTLGFIFRAQYRRAIASSGRFGGAKRLLKSMFRRGGGDDEEDE